ncbi:MAG: hypothetical protein ACPLKQ_06845 [Candidatus Bathyarchaeales archaeon]
MLVKKLKKFVAAKRALALPVTYLILLGSLLVMISITYSFAVTRLGTWGATLKVSVARQNMQFLDEAVCNVAWNTGASKIVYMENCGGIFKTDPSAKRLIINLTDGQAFSAIVFNNTLGKAFYELESSAESYEGLFVKGDSRAIINQTAFTMTQLYFARSETSQQIVLSYRPMANALTVCASNGKPLNLIRIYIISLDESETLTMSGSFYLKVSALNTVSTAYRYEFNTPVSSLALKASLEGVQTTVWLPIESNVEGAYVTLEFLVCNVKIQRVNV